MGFCIDAVTLGLYCSLFVQETNFWPELDILPVQSQSTDTNICLY